jgi:CrcB protein
MSWTLVLGVALGGALGALARWFLAVALRNVIEGFPVGTFAINAIGCFVFGLLWALHAGKWPAPVAAAAFTGFLGAFTTFSTFAFENLELWQQGRIVAFAVNVIGQNVVGVLAVVAGAALGKAA